MTNKLIYILISLLVICSISKGNDSAMVKIITIHYIYSLTETQHDISCKDFDTNQGKGGYMTKKLSTSVQINLFLKALDDYKQPPLVQRIDVRAKAYIQYSNGRISIVCVDQFGDIMINNKFIGVSSSLLSFLKSNCEGFE